MTPLSFKLRFKPRFTLDMSPITPDNLAGKKRSQIKEMPLMYGKEKVGIGDIFIVEGENNRHIEFRDSCEQFIYIGRGMTSGLIEAHGDAGDFVGQNLRNGRIIINGNAGSWAGNKMSGGRIDINGNAGNYVGAGLPGDAFGMTDGLIKILGNAGDRLGDRIRRGLIIVEGKAGDYCGSRIHAGTIIVLDKVGKHPGNGMRRGSLIFAKKPAYISATFKSCGNLKMQFLRLLFTQLAGMNEGFAGFTKYGVETHRFTGDVARNGKGEILILQTIRKR